MTKDREIEKSYPKGHPTTKLCIGMLLSDLQDPLRMRRLPPRSGFDKGDDNLEGAKAHLSKKLDKGRKATLDLPFLNFLLSKKQHSDVLLETDHLCISILDTGSSLLDHIKGLADDDDCQDYLRPIHDGPPDERFTFLITETWSFDDAKVTTDTGVHGDAKMGIVVPVTDAVTHGLSLALPSDMKPVDPRSLSTCRTPKGAKWVPNSKDRVPMSSRWCVSMFA